MNTKTQALAAAHAAWPRLAEIAGRLAADYRLSVLSARAEAEGRTRVVALAEAGEDRVILKFRVNGEAEAAQKMAEAHRSAARALADLPGYAAPEVLAFDPASGALLLSWVNGVTLQDAVSDGQVSVPDLVPHVGRWMAALHRRGETDHVPFNGAWMLRRLDQMAAKGVPATSRFAACRTALGQMADQLHDAPVHRAVIHGDLKLGNLMWDGQVMTGIDFENTGLHPVCRDAAMVLCDCIIWAPTGMPLTNDVMTAFVDRLGADVVDRDMLRFFIALRLLQIWARTPVRAMDRVGRKAHVWRRVRDAAQQILLEWEGGR